MHNPFDFFDYIYCINLDSRPDRWTEAQAEFDKVGIKHKVFRFPGVVLPDTHGSLGSSESHRQVNKLLLEKLMIHSSRKDMTYLIFEDDVKFKDNALENLEKSLTDLQTIEWDLFFLGCNMFKGYEKITDTLVKPHQAYALHAYAVKSKVCEIMSFESYGIMDVFVNRFIVSNPEFTCYSAYPMIATQRESYSDIEQKVTNYSHMDDTYK